MTGPLQWCRPLSMEFERQAHRPDNLEMMRNARGNDLLISGPKANLIEYWIVPSKHDCAGFDCQNRPNLWLEAMLREQSAWN